MTDLLSDPVQIDRADIADVRVSRLGDALSRAHLLYRRGSLLVQPPITESVGCDQTLRIVPHTRATIERYASVAASYVARKKNGDAWEYREAAFPRADAAMLLESAAPPPAAPPIEQVLETPALLESGRVLSRQGYDHETRSYVARGIDVDVTLRTSDAESASRAAVDTLWGLVDQVPFRAGRDGSAFGAWISSMLTPFARLLYRGPSPGLFVDASAPGAGKTRLCQIIGGVAFGRRIGPTDLPGNGDEAHKKLFSLALNGEPVVFFDNVRSRVSGSAIEGALTSDTITGRVLGQSRIDTVRWSPLWLISGNNASVSRDMSERLMHCRLSVDSRRARFSRRHYRIADVHAHIDSRREQYARACLTMLRAAQLLGWPMPDMGTWGSYEGWSRVVLSALHVAGVTDPREGMAAWAEQADDETRTLSAVVQAWGYDDSYRAAEIHELISDRHAYGPLRDALLEWLPDPKGSPRSIGRCLANVVDRPTPTGRIVAKKNRVGVLEYSVEPAGGSQTDGEVEDDSIPF